MFTGIVEEVGHIESFKEKKNAWELIVKNPFAESDGLEQGASISVNGCCLTLCEMASEWMIFELLEETLKKTCLLYTSPSPRDLSTSRMPSSA